MAKYTVYCFKDYDELLDWESNHFGKYGKETNHEWWGDNGRIQVVKLTLLDDFQPIETIDELCFVNCSIDDCKNEKFLHWYKELERKQADQVKRIKELEEKMRKEHEDDPPVYIYPFVVSDEQNS